LKKEISDVFGTFLLWFVICIFLGIFALIFFGSKPFKEEKNNENKLDCSEFE
jgi:hypothetical protein